MDEAADADLLGQAREGDDAAFATLVDRHKARIAGYVARLTGSRERGEELAQEAFVRLFVSARPNGSPSLGPWLYRVATNLVVSEERRAGRLRRIALYLGWNGHEHPRTQEAALIADEDRRDLAAALAALPLQFRVPLVLREVEGLSYEEIAQVEGCPLGTVRSRINRARALLRERLGHVSTEHGHDR